MKNQKISNNRGNLNTLIKLLIQYDLMFYFIFLYKCKNLRFDDPVVYTVITDLKNMYIKIKELLVFCTLSNKKKTNITAITMADGELRRTNLKNI